MGELPLSATDIQDRVSRFFVAQMPFNRLLEMELYRQQADSVQLYLAYQDKLMGNPSQSILHGGVIAAILDVASGIVCVSSALTRHVDVTEQQLNHRLSRMGTVDLHVNYLRPGRGSSFIATATLLRSGNKIAVAQANLHNQDQIHIATATITYIIG